VIPFFFVFAFYVLEVFHELLFAKFVELCCTLSRFSPFFGLEWKLDFADSAAVFPS
jgi:hypothetical protein